METGMLTRAVLKGVFEPILKERVNYVNAALTAESRGVDVIESKHAGKHNLLEVKIHSKGNIFTVAGLSLVKKRSASSKSTVTSSTLLRLRSCWWHATRINPV